MERPRRHLYADSRVGKITNAQRSVFESLWAALLEEAEPDFTGADETFRTLRFRELPRCEWPTM